MPKRQVIAFLILVSLTQALAGVAAVYLSRSLSPIIAIAVTSAICTTVIAMPVVLSLRQLNRSSSELEKGVKELTAGEFGAKVYVDAPELIEMGRLFNTLSERLAERFSQFDADRQQLRTILGGMVEGVIAIDSKQRMLFSNEKAASLLEFHSKMAIGHKLWEIVRHRPILSLVDKSLEASKPQREEFDWKGTTDRSLAIYVAPLPDSPGQGAILVLHDLSELRRLEQLRHEFVANVSHELKTPLSVIKACVETLQDGAIDDAENRHTFLDQINENADRLHNLILDLLSLARIESGTEPMEIRNLTIQTLVRECVDGLKTRADAKRQSIEIQSPKEPSAAEIRTDEDALRHILENLLDNAIKYTPDSGQIIVRWYGRGDQIVFEVQDNGIGIPEIDLPRIFERFYRVDKARSREMGGTGLGLAIVKNLSQILRGNVVATSKLGHGSVFTVSLPRSAG